MKRRCRKHSWKEVTIRILYGPDLAAGGINCIYRNRRIEICTQCPKVRNIKEK